MKKTIILIFLFSILLVECGKKGDPVYKDSRKLVETKMFG
tara:strand:- start:304 stop:423 length:120 start_codon:yes stop_codon:yes gene_type:complete